MDQAVRPAVADAVDGADPDYELLFQSVPEPCAVLAPDFTVVAVNKSYLDAMQLARHELVGRSLIDVWLDVTSESGSSGARHLRASLNRVGATMGPDPMPVQMFRTAQDPNRGGADQNRCWSPRNVPVVVSGKLRYIIHTITDVSGVGDSSPESGDENETTLLDNRQQRLAVLAIRTRETAEVNRVLKDENAELSRQLAHNSRHDPLTGLANRSAFVEHIEELIARQVIERFDVGVVVLNLDDLQRINDVLGHSAGDSVLIEVSMRLRDVMGPDDMCVRLSGDEFALVTPVGGGIDELTDLARRILANLRDPVPAGADRVVVTASLGLSMSSWYDRQTDAEVLLREADLAMNRSKVDGKNSYSVFDESLHVAALARLGTEQALRAALAEGQFRMLYQPETDLQTGQIRGFEALIRWQHPERGTMRPDQFLPVAKATGMMEQIDTIVLDTACRESRKWSKYLDEHSGRVWVNLSAQRLRDPELADVVAEVLRTTETPPTQIGIEITETLAMDSGFSRRQFESVVDLGVEMAIDDFGTGYSSLANLKNFPASMLKLDQSLTAEVAESDDATSIARAAIDMGHTLGLRVLAEGVETRSQRERLVELKCDTGQGWHLGLPEFAENINL